MSWFSYSLRQRLRAVALTWPAMPRLIVCLGVLLALSANAHADALRVLTTGAFKPVVQAVAADWEKLTGQPTQIVNDTAGNLHRRVKNGEAFDILILTPAALRDLDDAGLLVKGSPIELARVGIGVAVLKGQPKPRLADADDFVQALKTHRAIAYIDPASGGSSGIYLQGLFQKMGLVELLANKSVRVPGGLVAEKLVSGEADLAIHQISEILAVPGVDLVGPLPASLQNYTRYAGALGQRSQNAEAALAFLNALASPMASPVITRLGMER